MSNTVRDRLCVICRKLIPAGVVACRRGISFVHVECANKTKEAPPRLVK